MTLKLNEIEVACIIGDRPDERVRLQTLRIDAEIEIPLNAATSDHLCETIDYAALTDAIRSSLVAAKCQMIERAAKIAFDACAAACQTVAGARPMRVTVTKFGAIPGLASASVVYP